MKFFDICDFQLCDVLWFGGVLKRKELIGKYAPQKPTDIAIHQ